MKRANYLIRLAVTAAIVAGCKSFQPQPLAPEKTAAEFDARSLTSPALAEFVRQNLPHAVPVWPPATWDLDSLTLAAICFQPDLAVARAELQEAKAGIKTARAMPNPTVSAFGGYNFDAASGVNPWMPGFSLDVPVETAGKRGKRIAHSKHLAASARWKFAGAIWQTRANLRASLIESIAASQRETLLQKQADAQAQLVGILEHRLQAGDISRAEISPARIALARSQMDLNDARQQNVAARMKIANAIGVPAKSLDGIQFDFDLSQIPAGAADLISAEARSAALRSRADILSALEDYAASEEALRLEIAKQYPDIHLNSGFQWDQGERKWQPGITFDLPVLNHNRGPIAEAEAQRTAAAARFAALQSRVINEIDRAVAAFEIVRENLSTLASLAATQRQQAATTEAQFKLGAIERADFLNAQNEAAGGGLARLDAQVKLQQTIADLEAAVQRPTGWSTALENISPKTKTPKRQKHE